MYHRFPFAWQVVLLSAVLAPSPGCHRRFREPVSVINVTETSTANQLAVGFYAVEANSWRWTARRFEVLLKPPPKAESTGASLQLKLFISEAQMKALGPMTLSADAGGYMLAPETFSQAGAYTYSRDMSPASMATDIVPVKFSFDKALCPSASEARELAAVVTSVGFVSK